MPHILADTRQPSQVVHRAEAVVLVTTFGGLVVSALLVDGSLLPSVPLGDQLIQRGIEPGIGGGCDRAAF
jgi:hypothetical protein